MFDKQQTLYVHQRRELAEIILGFETRNVYEVIDESQQQVARIEENGHGFAALLKRIFLRSHRPLRVQVFDTKQQVVLEFKRNFFFFFSDLFIHSKENVLLGSVHRRFGIIYKKYTLKDPTGMEFAYVRSPIWKLWTFPLLVPNQLEPAGSISKKWSGALREFFTDADVFKIDYGLHPWKTQQRAVILGAAVAIDFDFFEENANRSGLLGG